MAQLAKGGLVCDKPIRGSCFQVYIQINQKPSAFWAVLSFSVFSSAFFNCSASAANNWPMLWLTLCHHKMGFTTGSLLGKKTKEYIRNSLVLPNILHGSSHQPSDMLKSKLWKSFKLRMILTSDLAPSQRPPKPPELKPISGHRTCHCYHKFCWWQKCG